LLDALQLLPVDELSDVNCVKWELIHASSVGLWDRVNLLIQRWIVLSPSSQPEAWAAAARIHFLRLSDFTTNGINQTYWLAYEPGTLDFGSHTVIATALLAPTAHDVTVGRWTAPSTFDDTSAGVVIEAVAATTKARLGIDSLEVRVLSAWSRAADGTRGENSLSLTQAAKDFYALAQDEHSIPLYSRLACRFATVLFRQASRWDEARAAAMLWTELDKESEAPWEVLSGLENSLASVDSSKPTITRQSKPTFLPRDRDPVGVARQQP
jgi:hypothetical protein